MISPMTSATERIGRLDVLVTAVVGVLAVVYTLPEVTGAEDYELSVLALPVSLSFALPMLWRRSAPNLALGGLLGAVVLGWALFPDGVRCGLVIPLLLFLAFAAGARLGRRDSLIGLALVVGVAVAVCGLDGPSGAPLAAALFVAPLGAGVWAIGRVVHSRGRMVEELRARTGELRAARDERAKLEVADERSRLSAELGELLQRRLGELAELADEAGHGDRAQTTAALEQIERESRLTLEEMRALVGVLRAPGAEAPVAPQPTLTHLEAMLVRAKGAEARLRVEGDPRAVPPGVELSAYRIVEQLLDALQDVPDVEVCVRFADDALELSVAGPLRRRGQDAIERARERARLIGGTLQATTRDGRAVADVSLPVLVAA
jgi:signal transduction histidine kinase